MAVRRQVDPYAVLGVSRGAPSEQIKKAYRKLAREFHPDKNRDNPEAELRFKEIQTAYELIGRDDKRRQFDIDNSSPFESFGPLGGGPLGVSSLFRQPSTGPRPRPPMRGHDIDTEVTISFLDALSGATAQIEIEVDEPCAECGGDRSRKLQCTDCGGNGLSTDEGDEFAGTRICSRCGGDGHVSCNLCGGSGSRRDPRKHKIRIPAGVDEGTRIRIPGKGGAGVSGGPQGDLYVTTRVQSSELYERQARNLILTVPVTYAEATLGATVELPTPDGPISLKVPPFSHQGRLLRVRGRGVRALDGEGERGDLFARIELSTPESISERERELLGELQAASSEDPRAHFFPNGAPAAPAASTDDED